MSEPKSKRTTHNAHRHEDFWPRPDEWLAERWLPENAAALAPHATTAWMPFSVGLQRALACQPAGFACCALGAVALRLLRIDAPPSQELTPSFTLVISHNLRSAPARASAATLRCWRRRCVAECWLLESCSRLPAPSTLLCNPAAWQPPCCSTPDRQPHRRTHGQNIHTRIITHPFSGPSRTAAAPRHIRRGARPASNGPGAAADARE